jgi:hypothetical protein
MRGQVCHLQLPLALTSTVILSTKSCRNDDHYCLRFETPPAWSVRFPFLYPPGTEWPSYTPRYWVPFSLPPMTYRTMVEVSEPSSTRVTGLIQLTLPQPQLIYDWPFTSNQFVLASSLLMLITIFFATEHLQSYSLYNILHDERMSLSLYTWPLSRVNITHLAPHRKFFTLQYIQVLCHPMLCRAYCAYLSYLMQQQQPNYLNGHKLDRCQV